MGRKKKEATEAAAPMKAKRGPRKMDFSERVNREAQKLMTKLGVKDLLLVAQSEAESSYTMAGKSSLGFTGVTCKVLEQSLMTKINGGTMKPEVTVKQ
jgi:hypothetical protein